VSSGKCIQMLRGHDGWVNSVAFSHDSAWLASGSYGGMVKIWNVSSGECLQTLSTDKTLYGISFNITDSCLHTDIGTIDVSALSRLITPSTDSVPQNPQYRGLALSSDRVWITHNSENLVWLPSEYRPVRSVVSENIIGIGAETGRVWICKVSPTHPDALKILCRDRESQASA
jgi:WD40 repeat protein